LKDNEKPIGHLATKCIVNLQTDETPNVNVKRKYTASMRDSEKLTTNGGDKKRRRQSDSGNLSEPKESRIGRRCLEYHRPRARMK
jgi:hypothetical protein